MTRLADYHDRYSFIAFDRTPSGILTMRLHRAGGPLKWTSKEGGAHDQIGSALWNVGRDPENRVVILTGTADSFLVDVVPEEYAPFDAENWTRITREGNDIISGLLEIDRPLITVVNGPVTLRPEIAVLGDVVLASTDAYFQDSHIVNGIVPGDGCQSVWLELLGPNRGRVFLMTGQILTALELQALGVIAEVLPREQLLPRAKAIAAKWLTWSPEVLTYSHIALTHTLRKRVLDEVGYGHAIEGLGKYGNNEWTHVTPAE
jgi:enoyl-CoA hydratase/carnithine racemase